MPGSQTRWNVRNFMAISSMCLGLAACAGGPGTKFNDSAQNAPRQQLAAVAIGSISGVWDDSTLGDTMDKADKIYAQRTAQDAMEYNNSGQTSTWRNPKSGNSGTVTPLKTYENRSGKNCRKFRTSIYVNGDQEKGTGTACRQPDGTWQIES